MDETKDVKFTRAHHKLKTLDAAGQSYTDEFNETVCAVSYTHLTLPTSDLV